MSEHTIAAPLTEVEIAPTEWQRTTPERFSRDAYREVLDGVTCRDQPEGDSTPSGGSVESHRDAQELEEGNENLAGADAAERETSSPAAVNTDDLGAVRELILTLHPAIVPELIGGDSIAALIASVIPAQEAYTRIVANVRVPAGGNPVTVVDVDTLSTYEKIRRGLKTHPSRLP